MALLNIAPLQGATHAGWATASLGANPLAWAQAWRERRMAERQCRAMLALHGALADMMPGLGATRLYREVAAAHLGVELHAPLVDEVLQGATDSFALWPVERALTFRDVVHYLALYNIFSAAAGPRAVRADVRRVVETIIPHHL